MSKVKITRETFSAALHEAVAERGGDFVYPDEWKRDIPDSYVSVCQYYADGVGPACLIGVALSKLGVPDEYLAKIRGGAANELRRLGVEDGPLLDAAVIAQMSQDGGHTWGVALNDFDATLELSIKENKN